MLIEIDRKFQMVLLIFIISMGVLYRLKLPIMFQKDGKIKDFGRSGGDFSWEKTDKKEALKKEAFNGEN